MKYIHSLINGELIKTNESINWLRLDKDNKIYRVGKKYKREFHN